MEDRLTPIDISTYYCVDCEDYHEADDDPHDED